MSKWAIVSLSVSIVFGFLAVVAVILGIMFLTFAPLGGVLLFVFAVVLALLAMSSMRSYRQLGGR